MTENVKKNSRERKKDSKHSRNRWVRLDTTIIAALIGVVGVALGVVLPHYLNAAPPPGPNLEVDSVTAQSYARWCAERHPDIPVSLDLPGSETLDFKLRNTGNQLALITGIRVAVKSISINPHPGGFQGAGKFIPLSARYGFVIPIKEGIFVAPVSEEVAAGQTDRFNLNILLPKNASTALYTYQLNLELVYDKSNSISAGSMSLGLSSGYIIENVLIISNSNGQVRKPSAHSCPALPPSS